MRLVANIIVFVIVWLAIPAYAGAETIDESLRTLMKQAESGDAKANYDLGYVYEKGVAGIEKDMSEAIRLYTLSAEAGYAPAQNYLGFCYYRGDGVDRDAEKALFWIQKAADQGDAKGFNNLGWLLLEGDGVVHDAQKAAYWFGRAAEVGLPTAQCQLADLYKSGVGVVKDSLMADSLYHQAMYAGLEDAERKLLAMNHLQYTKLNVDEALLLGKKYYYDTHFLLAATLFESQSAKQECHLLQIIEIKLYRKRHIFFQEKVLLAPYFYDTKRKLWTEVNLIFQQADILSILFLHDM